MRRANRRHTNLGRGHEHDLSMVTPSCPEPPGSGTGSRAAVNRPVPPPCTLCGHCLSKVVAEPHHLLPLGSYLVSSFTRGRRGQSRPRNRTRKRRRTVGGSHMPGGHSCVCRVATFCIPSARAGVSPGPNSAFTPSGTDTGFCVGRTSPIYAMRPAALNRVRGRRVLRGPYTRCPGWTVTRGGSRGLHQDFGGAAFHTLE